MKKRIITILLCGTLLFSAIPTASADGSYTGVSTWFEPSLREMQQLDLLPSSFSGKDLSEDITRGEMCELAVQALEIITDFSLEPERNDYFSDTTDVHVIKAYELGIVNGYPDGTFRPDNKLTRQEFFQIVENFCNAAAFLPSADSSYLSTFSDRSSVADWAKEAAQICIKYGYVNGRGDGTSVTLDPTGNTTRQEAMAMFLRAYKSLNEYYYYIKNAQVVVEDNTGSTTEDTAAESTVVDDVTVTSADKQMSVTAANLNVRTSWSTNGKILGTLTHGTEVTVTGLCENGWVQIRYEGQTAYVNGEYLSDITSDNIPTVDTNSGSSREDDDSDDDDDSSYSGNTSNSTAVNIANLAVQYVGYPYVYGAKDPAYGFDCSGLVYYCYGQYGITLQRTANDQMNTNGVSVSRDNLQVGDLVFFGSGSYANHVGIYIGNGNFVHAANPASGVRISSLNETYYVNRYIGARRIITN